MKIRKITLPSADRWTAGNFRAKDGDALNLRRAG
jgi:hypothetical protein